MGVVDSYVIKFYYIWEALKSKELDGTSQKGKCEEMVRTERATIYREYTDWETDDTETFWEIWYKIGRSSKETQNHKIQVYEENF